MCVILQEQVEAAGDRERKRQEVVSGPGMWEAHACHMLVTCTVAAYMYDCIQTHAV